MISNGSRFCILFSTFVIGRFACNKEKSGQILTFTDIIVPGVTIPLNVIIRDGCHRSSRILTGIVSHICDNILNCTLANHVILLCQFCGHNHHVHRIFLTAAVRLRATSTMIKLPVKLCTRSRQYILIQCPRLICIQFCKLCAMSSRIYLMPFQRLFCMRLSGIFVILICGGTDILNLCITGCCFPNESWGSVGIKRLITGIFGSHRCLKISIFQLVVVADLKFR